MPHIILEHNITDESRVKLLCRGLHQALSEQETVKLESIKTRSIFVSNLFIGAFETGGNFAHVSLKLLAGRTEDQKIRMSRALLNVLSSDINGSLSVDVQELSCYQKNS